MAGSREDRERWDMEYEHNKTITHDSTMKQGNHPLKQIKMEVKLNQAVQGKVKSVTGSGTYKDMFSFEYTFEDGVIMKANHKTDAPRFAPGDDVEYTVKFSNAYGNLGSIDKPQDQQRSGGHSTPQPSHGINTNDSILYQVSLKIASDVLINGYNPAFENTFPTGQSINDLALDIATKAKENITKL